MQEEEKKDCLYQPLIESNIKKTKREKKIASKTILNSPFFVFKKIKDLKIKNDVIIIPKKLGIAVYRNYLRRIIRHLLQKYRSNKKDVQNIFYLIIFHQAKNQEKIHFSTLKNFFN